MLKGEVYSFLQVDGREDQAHCGSYRNVVEAHRVIELIQNLSSSAQNDTEWYSSEKVRIITFYQAQVALIRQLLRQRGLQRVLVATVDSSQGCEANLVIVSFVRSNCGWRPSASSGFCAGFLNDDRRMNVALTRAKYQLVCIGNAQAMNRMVAASTISGLVTDAERRNCIVGTDGCTEVAKRKQPATFSNCRGRSNNFSNKKVKS